MLLPVPPDGVEAGIDAHAEAGVEDEAFPLGHSLKPGLALVELLTAPSRHCLDVILSFRRGWRVYATIAIAIAFTVAVVVAGVIITVAVAAALLLRRGGLVP